MSNKPKIFLVLKILGFVSLIGGIALIVLGTAIFPQTYSGNPVAPNAALFAPGMVLAVLAIPMLIIGFSANLAKLSVQAAKYIQEQNKDDLTKIVDDRAEIVGGAVKKTAKNIKEGLKDTKYCKHCGAEIDNDSKFCRDCGKEQ